MTVVKFPYAVSRRAHARKPRWSKNGTPEERAGINIDDAGTEAVAALPPMAGPPRLVAGTAYLPSTETECPPLSTETLPITARNGRLRKERWKAWRRAHAVQRYWRALLDLADIVSLAKNEGISELIKLPCDRNTILAKWREVLVEQMRTPAYDLSSLKWKQDALAREAWAYTGTTPERLKQVIADDAAWLAEHPTRRTKDRA